MLMSPIYFGLAAFDRGRFIICMGIHSRNQLLHKKYHSRRTYFTYTYFCQPFLFFFFAPMNRIVPLESKTPKYQQVSSPLEKLRQPGSKNLPPPLKKTRTSVVISFCFLHQTFPSCSSTISPSRPYKYHLSPPPPPKPLLPCLLPHAHPS